MCVSPKFNNYQYIIIYQSLPDVVVHISVGYTGDQVHVCSMLLSHSTEFIQPVPHLSAASLRPAMSELLMTTPCPLYGIQFIGLSVGLSLCLTLLIPRYHTEQGVVRQVLMFE